MRKRSILAAAAIAATLAVTGAGAAAADPGPGAHAEGEASNSPGVGSGNLIQFPIDVPINVCGNTVNVGGLLNPAGGNVCENG
ncbi:chaplin [Streptomyces sp. G45]|uniref:chaplin n=1 Tax=Streptomyces sp. G45 TaxID=3406627 RepID=UPI003C241452